MMAAKTPLSNVSDRYELLARIASLYFEDGLSQAEIAAQTGYSRSMISRFLTEARDQHIVEIRINHPLARNRELEQSLEQLLKLRGVQVLTRGALNYSTMMRRIGTLGARLTEDLLHDHTVIGVSWGTAVWEVVNAARGGGWTDVQIVQMIGSLGTTNPDIDGPELARRLARIFGGRYSMLPTPFFVDARQTRDALLGDPRIKRILAQYARIELALVGVGTIDPERSSILRAGYVTEQDLDELRALGAVGDVCGIHFDLGGACDFPVVDERRLGISVDELRAIPVKLGVAGGQYKAKAIVGAARAGLINWLVTDEVAALGALQLAA